MRYWYFVTLNLVSFIFSYFSIKVSFFCFKTIVKGRCVLKFNWKCYKFVRNSRPPSSQLRSMSQVDVVRHTDCCQSQVHSLHLPSDFPCVSGWAIEGLLTMKIECAVIPLASSPIYPVENQSINADWVQQHIHCARTASAQSRPQSVAPQKLHSRRNGHIKARR